MQLYIGNKNYSSWSLRPWLLLKKFNVNFDEVKLDLATPEFYQQLVKISPACKVPTLVDDKLVVWDSLAICEYINEAYLSGRAWPNDSFARAKARALSSEMHAGFAALRNEMPMNIRAKRIVNLSADAKKDIQRVCDIWTEQLFEYDGWLFGEWSIADAMFAPVVHRFITYGIDVNKDVQAYMTRTLACDAMQKWISEAMIETAFVSVGEAGEDV